MSGRLRMAIAAAIAVVMLAAGCGGGSGSGSGSGGGGAGAAAAGEEGGSESTPSAPEAAESSLTRAQFVKKANALCSGERSESFQELTSFAQRHAKEGKPERTLLKDMVREAILPRIERELRKLAELGAPAGDEEEVQEFLTAEYEAYKRALALEEPKTLQQVEHLFAKAGAMARAYGIDACDNGGAPKIPREN